MEKLVVTTALKINQEIIREAREIAAHLKIPYLARENNSLNTLAQKNDASGVLVLSADKLKLVHGEEEYFFHPNMAKIRLRDLLSGKPDQMAKAMDLSSGDIVLDCTLGLGADALVESFVTGPTGQVIGLEKVPVIALVAQKGFQKYIDNNKVINQALRRIKVINADFNEFLKDASTNSYDVVYFDPMFRHPNMRSSAINAFRRLAEHEPLSKETVSLKRATLNSSWGSIISIM